MKPICILAASAALLLGATSASAQYAPPPQDEPAPAADPAPGAAAPAYAPLPPSYPPSSHGPQDYAPPPPREREVQSGFTMALREGLAFPSGRTAEGATDSFGTMFPVGIASQFDVGVRLPAGLALGGYLAVALVVPDCNVNVTCSAVQFRAGLQADWRFNQLGRVMPWVGASYGWEFFDYLQDNGLSQVDQTLSGTEWGLQGGLDIRIGRKFAVGPYGQLTFGTYDQGSVTVDDVEVSSGSIPSSDRSAHQWFGLGVKATLTL